jgi:endonuclease/exonuclease/phosphatase family metal-dependent hydrolase
MTIVTYNIRNVYQKDGINSFVHRAGLIVDTILEKNPDIICFQEATEKIITMLRRCLAPEYTVLFTQREEGLSGEGLAVAYRQDRCTLYGLEIFWLSPTPHVIASKFPGQSKHSRICQKLLFKNEQTGKLFKLYNIHLEERSEEVRVQQMELVMEHWATETVPTLLMGDFNTVPTGKVYPSCTERGLVDLTGDISVTFHKFGQMNPGWKLDYIFTDAATAALAGEVCVWDHCVNGIYLSDHYPLELSVDL